jgi:4-hydroxybenzoate polyprenyltransferase
MEETMREIVPAKKFYPGFSKLSGLVELARPTICVLGFAGVYLGYWLSTHEFDITNLKCLNGAIVAALAMAYGNTINDVLDREIDAIIFPFRPIPAGIVSPRYGLLSGGVIAGTALLLGSSLGKAVFILILSGLLLVTLYNLWAKRLRLIGNVLIAIISVIPGLMGNLIAGEGFLPLSLLAALVIFVLAREIYRTIHDGPGDLVTGRQSIFLSLGKGKTLLIAFSLGLIGTILLMLYPFDNQVRYPAMYVANVLFILGLLVAIGSFIFYCVQREVMPPYYDALLTLLMRSVFCLACLSLIWII